MALYTWNGKNFDKEFNVFLETVAECRPDMLSKEGGEKNLLFRKASEPGALRVSCKGGSAVIEAGSLAGFARGLGFAFAGTDAEESTGFRTLGIMLDCSRNKVFRPDYLKDYFLKMALMGCNFAMLYTEDTYVLPGEPYFGWMRGGYTLEEIQELDSFAAKLGIEVVGCIQTLGHLAEILQHPAYAKIQDTSSVLRVGEPETYALIEKMVAFWKKAVRSKRIHIGMDETHDLGRGRYMDLNGYVSGPELFRRHLAKVNAICKKHHLTPILWSDMYFRLADKDRNYYYDNPRIPESVKAGIPKNVRLCYWDYYHDNAEFYEKYIECHRSLGSEPILGSGIWTWARFWCDFDLTLQTVVPCMEACRRTKLREIFFTMWGDLGGYCMYDSSLAGLELVCGLAYGEKPSADDLYEKRFRAVCGGDFALFRDVSAIHRLYGHAKYGYFSMPADRLFWEDPLIGADEIRCEYERKGCIADYRKELERLSVRLDAETELSDSLHAVRELVRVLIRRFEFRHALLAAYARNDRTALRKIAMDLIPSIRNGIEAFAGWYRSDWMRTARPFGLEVIQRREAGLSARFGEVQTRILEYLDGKRGRIEELDSALKIESAVKESGFAPAVVYSGSCIQ